MSKITFLRASVHTKGLPANMSRLHGSRTLASKAVVVNTALQLTPVFKLMPHVFADSQFVVHVFGPPTKIVFVV